MPRLYPFQSVQNFRDFGDYPVASGRHIKPDLLFRSAHLNQAAPDVHELLRARDLSLIVDLRQLQERERQPNRLPDLPVLRQLEFPTPDALLGNALAPHEMFLKEELYEAADARRYMMGSYAARPNLPGFMQLAKSSLTHMAQTGGSILVHCAAGKDRTGTLVALMQGLLGMEPDLIMDDYMLTLELVDIDSMLEPAAERASAVFGRSIDPEALRPMFEVSPDYLWAALTEMGDYEAYATATLGVSAEQLEAMRAAYLYP